MKWLFKALVILAALAGIASAADKPNFSGDWKMNASRSNFGQVPAPATYTRKVTHAEPSLTIEDTQTGTPAGDQHDQRIYTTDGTEITYQANGADVKSSAVWQDDAILITSKANAQGIELQFKDKMALSEGGKTLTDSVHIQFPQGELDITVVFEKQ